MGKASAPAAPNYAPIAAADQQMAQDSYQLGQQQLQWGKDQFNTVWPYAQQYLTQQVNSSAANTASAQAQQQYYDKTYQPIETSFANTANNYNSPTQANQMAGQAEADVANNFDAQRASSLQSLESYGIDPSQTRYGALDLGTRISQAAATAAAGTQSRLNTQATGLALQGEAINIGRGYPSSIAQSYDTATNAGNSGMATANSTINTGANAMNSSVGFMNSANGFNNSAVGALNTGYNNALAGAQFTANQNANFMGGLGSLFGAGLGVASTNLSGSLLGGALGL